MLHLTHLNKHRYQVFYEEIPVMKANTIITTSNDNNDPAPVIKRDIWELIKVTFDRTHFTHFQINRFFPGTTSYKKCYQFSIYICFYKLEQIF